MSLKDIYHRSKNQINYQKMLMNAWTLTHSYVMQSESISEPGVRRIVNI